jgi:DNA-binding transcriptional ArsR family regulator/ubiquinone/menaquinone biosynthesis C-methylase UbiE
MILTSGLPLLSSVHRLRAIAEPTRLRLICLLAQGELTVSEISQILGQSQPRVSRHLKLLLDAGLVTRLPEGAWVFYRLVDGSQGSASTDLVKMLIESLDERDPVIAGDLERLTEVKVSRAADAAAYFEANADEWKRIQSIYQPIAEVEAAMISLLGPRPVEFLVDFGTGTGRVLEALSCVYSHAIGFDTNHAMLGVARVNLDRARIRHAHVQHGNLLSLPKLVDEPDAVVIHQVLHYLDNPRAAVASAARLLSPNGRLLIVDYAPHELEFLRTEHAHRRLGFSDSEVFEWCRAAGLNAEEVRQVQPAWETSSEVPSPVVSLWLASRPQSSQVADGLEMAG